MHIIVHVPSAQENAQIAQLVEQRTENPRVAGSIPALGICGCSSMVEHQPSKLDTWVRFPSPAFFIARKKDRRVIRKDDTAVFSFSLKVYFVSTSAPSSVISTMYSICAESPSSSV